jgi:hypothetical protein
VFHKFRETLEEPEEENFQGRINVLSPQLSKRVILREAG